MMKSAFCTYAQLNSAPFLHWQEVLLRQPPRPHRKDWELSFIAQALFERGLLQAGKSGLGFGCGVEPLPCLFASLGVNVLATDGPAREQWVGQHVGSGDYRERLEGQHLMDAASWERLSFVEEDMTAIDRGYDGQFDFVWSTSALEHLGSLAAGRDFILASLRCLKPGGVAVHVTEHSLYPSGGDEEQRGGTVWFTKVAIEQMLTILPTLGGQARVQWGYGEQPADYYVDTLPWQGHAHLKLLVDGYVTTSFGLIVEKGNG